MTPKQIFLAATALSTYSKAVYELGEGVDHPAVIIFACVLTFSLMGLLICGAARIFPWMNENE